MSRSWPRVMSPMPGRSTLITSAPNQASSWVQVGPDCTCVKSRMRTPDRALLMVSPCVLLRRRGRGQLRLQLREAVAQIALVVEARGLVADDRRDGLEPAVGRVQ